MAPLLHFIPLEGLFRSSPGLSPSLGGRRTQSNVRGRGGNSAALGKNREEESFLLNFRNCCHLETLWLLFELNEEILYVAQQTFMSLCRRGLHGKEKRGIEAELATFLEFLGLCVFGKGRKGRGTKPRNIGKEPG